MSASSREKDQTMAQHLKARGEERTTGRCCLCYNIITVGYPQLGSPSLFDSHLMKCGGTSRSRVGKAA